jgi:polysaccharide export outer membrane protein
MRTEPNPSPIEHGSPGTVIGRPNRLRAAGGLLLALLGATLWSGCQNNSNMAPIGRPSDTTLALLPGDTVHIAFPTSPDMDQSQKIREDGKINLPVVGEVKAAGETVDELQDDLQDLYKKELTQDQVVVTLENSESAIYVTGAVNKPGDIIFDRPMTALEAIMESGGFTYVADTGRVHLIRETNGQQITTYLDLRSAMHGEPTKAVYLQAGDIIYVPEKAFTF